MSGVLDAVGDVVDAVGSAVGDVVEAVAENPIILAGAAMIAAPYLAPMLAGEGALAGAAMAGETALAGGALAGETAALGGLGSGLYGVDLTAAGLGGYGTTAATAGALGTGFADTALASLGAPSATGITGIPFIDSALSAAGDYLTNPKMLNNLAFNAGGQLLTTGEIDPGRLATSALTGALGAGVNSATSGITNIPRLDSAIGSAATGMLLGQDPTKAVVDAGFSAAGGMVGDAVAQEDIGGAGSIVDKYAPSLARNLTIDALRTGGGNVERIIAGAMGGMAGNEVGGGIRTALMPDESTLAEWSAGGSNAWENRLSQLVADAVPRLVGQGVSQEVAKLFVDEQAAQQRSAISQLAGEYRQKRLGGINTSLTNSAAMDAANEHARLGRENAARLRTASSSLLENNSATPMPGGMGLGSMPTITPAQAEPSVLSAEGSIADAQLAQQAAEYGVTPSELQQIMANSRRA